MVNININIPEDKKEIITAFNALINAFKNDIEDVNPVSYGQRKENLLPKKKDINYQKAKEEYITNYRGAFKIGDNAEEEYNQYRINKYGK